MVVELGVVVVVRVVVVVVVEVPLMGYRTSNGNSTNTGPGTPLMACWNALRSVGTIWRTLVQVAAYLTMGLRTLSWSMSCSEPRPLSIVAAAPPMSTTGLCAICVVEQHAER